MNPSRAARIVAAMPAEQGAGGETGWRGGGRTAGSCVGGFGRGAPSPVPENPAVRLVPGRNPACRATGRRRTWTTCRVIRRRPGGYHHLPVLGADHGYQLLWVLLVSTVALVIFHGLAARMGVVTGQGLIGLVRQRYGVAVGPPCWSPWCWPTSAPCAEFAGIAAGFELFGISRYLSVPIAAVAVSLLVLRGSFHRVERLCSCFPRCSSLISPRAFWLTRTGVRRYGERSADHADDR